MSVVLNTEKNTKPTSLKYIHIKPILNTLTYTYIQSLEIKRIHSIYSIAYCLNMVSEHECVYFFVHYNGCKFRDE